MVELAILVIGLAITGILALIKVGLGIVMMSWFWVWFPTLVAFLIVCGVWLLDFD